MIEINGFLNEYSVTLMVVFGMKRIEGRGSRATVESYNNYYLFFFFFWKIVIASKGSTVASNQFETIIKKEKDQPRVKKLSIPTMKKTSWR